MVKPIFFCTCEAEMSSDEEVFIHLQDNQEHLVRVKYHWVEE